MATLKVNLTKPGDGCNQDETAGGVWPANGWYAFLYNCNNTPFVHAKKEYGPFPIDHGYVEIKDVPAGRYLLFAIVNPFPIGVPIPGGEAIFQSNFTSHYAVVDVCCGCDDLCVTLYNSGWHYCVQVILYWFEVLKLQNKVDAKAADKAIAALKEVMVSAKQKPTPGDKSVIAQLEEITRQMRGGTTRVESSK